MICVGGHRIDSIILNGSDMDSYVVNATDYLPYLLVDSNTVVLSCDPSNAVSVNVEANKPWTIQL